MKTDTITELATTINRILAQATSSLEAENTKFRAALKDIAMGARQTTDFEIYAVRQAKRALKLSLDWKE